MPPVRGAGLRGTRDADLRGSGVRGLPMLVCWFVARFAKTPKCIALFLFLKKKKKMSNGHFKCGLNLNAGYLLVRIRFQTFGHTETDDADDKNAAADECGRAAAASV